MIESGTQRPAVKLEVLETFYRGITYRSRCEARWAVFLNALEMPFEYEPEGFKLGDLYYLPDFWLPDQSCFMEIKGIFPDNTAISKAERLAMATGHEVYIFPGNPRLPGHGKEDGSALKIWKEADGVPGQDDCYCWCECPRCGIFGIEFGGRADRLPCECQKSTHGNRGHNAESPLILAAYESAQSERFGT